MIRVVIADDQTLVRSGFRMILEPEEDIEVVADVGEGEAAVAAAAALRPDVMLMDVRMPRMDGIEATRRIMQTDHPPQIVVLTTFDLDELVFEALRAGASAFLLKDASADQLVSAIRVAADGGSLFVPSLTGRLIDRFSRDSDPAPPAELSELTGREREVLVLLARGHSNAEIARELVVTDHTVKTHIARILAKLGLRNRTQAVIAAYESALVTPRQR